MTSDTYFEVVMDDDLTLGDEGFIQVSAEESSTVTLNDFTPEESSGIDYEETINNSSNECVKTETVQYTVEDINTINTLVANPLHEDITETPEIETTYKILVGGSIRGMDKLFDSNGYTYTDAKKKRNIYGSKLWRCCHRGKNKKCNAGVRETIAGRFLAVGKHNHLGVYRAYEAAYIANKIKILSDENKDLPATQVVKRVLNTVEREGILPVGTQTVESLARNLNNARQKLRSRDPSTKLINALPAEKRMPSDFLQAEIVVEEATHLIFATMVQLKLLQKARNWYLDMTCRVLKHFDSKYKLLLTIHAFVKKGRVIKPVPLVFCLLSQRRRCDYEAVLDQIVQLTGPPRVRKVVIAFKHVVWKAVRHILPSVKVKGCPHSFAKAVNCQITSLDLRDKHQRGDANYKIIRKILALCYLPTMHINPVFKKLTKKAKGEKITELLDYMKVTWMESKIWNLASWSVYDMALRTNNDIETWRNLVNNITDSDISMHTIITFFRNQAAFCDSKVSIISAKKLKKKRKKCAGDSGDLYHLWSMFKKRRKNQDQLIRELSKLNF